MATTPPGRVGVMSSKTWRLADLFAKHAFLLNGLGWGGMPMHAGSTLTGSSSKRATKLRRLH